MLPVDIVERLRSPHRTMALSGANKFRWSPPIPPSRLDFEAADEIVRLRAAHGGVMLALHGAVDLLRDGREAEALSLLEDVGGVL